VCDLGSRTHLLFTDGNKITAESFNDQMTVLTDPSGDLFAIDVDIG
jgi:hypothetical protein